MRRVSSEGFDHRCVTVTAVGIDTVQLDGGGRALVLEAGDFIPVTAHQHSLTQGPLIVCQK
jgi:kynurenine formamidase